MFSSRADPAASGARRLGLLGGRSIATYIARFQILAAAVVLAIVSGLMYWVESRTAPWDDVQFLADKMRQLRLVIRSNSEAAAEHLEFEVKVEGGMHTPGQHYIFYSRILDEAGQVLVETPGMETILAAALFPPPLDAPDQQAQIRQTPDGRSYLLMSALEVADGGTNSAPRTIQVALDNTDDMNFISQSRHNSLLVAFLVVVLSAGISVLIARSGLRPLRYVARVAEQITANRLDRRLERRSDARIGTEHWPQELSALATAFDGMLDRIEDSHSRLAQFSADLAHELRTPIHVLMGRIEYALSKDREPHEYRRILLPNLEVLQTLARTIDGLLFLARAENPKTRIERQWFGAQRELEAVREFHEALAEAYGVSMACQGEAQLYADPLLVRRALTNLLSNALRHTPSGGQIVLSVEQARDNAVLLTVRDTGCGIRREDLPRVCERFFCSNQRAARCAEGPGLGLAIVKSIAELHGGTASVESRPGQGTTVVLRFPIPGIAAA